MRVSYFGIDPDMESHYTGTKKVFYVHKWMPAAGGLWRIVIAGRVLEVYRS